eukprot:CAMPEP_0170627960 /NCGR_PEP_ID=MMETSP0224-20130122/32356_1 /TAXON_ID=285029 /ORGANISM="Togula jolla, Strain CCCM 725" /LENGTH=344 /DNA_ID=CAMNT_0010955207 /DNA_START=1 /DNA_END=1032 /DNA_ORIENTATION=-
MAITLRRLHGHRAGVVGVCTARSGDLVLSSSEDGTLRLWDLRGHRSVRAVLVGKNLEPGAGEVAGELGHCAFRDEQDPGGVVYVASSSELLAFDLRGSDRVLMSGPPTVRATACDDINDFAVSPDGRTVALPTDAGDVELLATADLKPERTLKGGHQNIVGAVRFRNGGKELFSAGFDEKLILWDPSNGKLRTRLAAQQLIQAEEATEAEQANQMFNPPFILSLSVGPRDELAAGLGNGDVLVLPLDRRPPRGAAPWIARGAHAAAVDAVAWLSGSAGAKSPSVLASAGRDCVLRLWTVPASLRGEVSAAEPKAEVRLRDKPNMVCTTGSDTVIVADVSSDLSV